MMDTCKGLSSSWTAKDHFSGNPQDDKSLCLVDVGGHGRDPLSSRVESFVRHLRAQYCRVHDVGGTRKERQLLNVLLGCHLLT